MKVKIELELKLVHGVFNKEYDWPYLQRLLHSKIGNYLEHSGSGIFRVERILMDCDN